MTTSVGRASAATPGLGGRERRAAETVLQWRYECRTELGVLSLAGRLGATAAPRVFGAVGWALYRGEGPLILDLSAVTGWTSLGQGAVVEAAVRLAAHGRTMEITAPPAGGTSAIAGNRFAAIAIHADLPTALAVHGGALEADGQVREWRSVGWPEAAGSR